jgi:hypothetical protein
MTQAGTVVLQARSGTYCQVRGGAGAFLPPAGVEAVLARRPPSAGRDTWASAPRYTPRTIVWNECQSSLSEHNVTDVRFSHPSTGQLCLGSRLKHRCGWGRLPRLGHRPYGHLLPALPARAAVIHPHHGLQYPRDAEPHQLRDAHHHPFADALPRPHGGQCRPSVCLSVSLRLCLPVCLSLPLSLSLRSSESCSTLAGTGFLC